MVFAAQDTEGFGVERSEGFACGLNTTHTGRSDLPNHKAIELQVSYTPPTYLNTRHPSYFFTVVRYATFSQ